MIEESKNILESIKQGLQDIVVPEMREIKSEIRRLDDKMDNGFARLDGKIDSVRNELKVEIQSVKNELLSEIKRVDQKIDSGFHHLDQKIDLAINVHERLAASKNGFPVDSFPLGHCY